MCPTCCCFGNNLFRGTVSPLSQLIAYGQFLPRWLSFLINVSKQMKGPAKNSSCELQYPFLHQMIGETPNTDQFWNQLENIVIKQLLNCLICCNIVTIKQQWWGKNKHTFIKIQVWVVCLFLPHLVLIRHLLMAYSNFKP